MKKANAFKRVNLEKSNSMTPITLIEEYQVSMIGYALANSPKLLSFGIGVYITKVILYDQVLFNPNVNIAATIFFCLLALICFDACGIPISKFMNVVITNAKQVKP